MTMTPRWCQKCWKIVEDHVSDLYCKSKIDAWQASALSVTPWPLRQYKDACLSPSSPGCHSWRDQDFFLDVAEVYWRCCLEERTERGLILSIKPTSTGQWQTRPIENTWQMILYSWTLDCSSRTLIDDSVGVAVVDFSVTRNIAVVDAVVDVEASLSSCRERLSCRLLPSPLSRAWSCPTSSGELSWLSNILFERFCSTPSDNFFNRTISASSSDIFSARPLHWPPLPFTASETASSEPSSRRRIWKWLLH